MTTPRALPGEKPAAVTRAVQLLYLTLLISIVNFFLVPHTWATYNILGAFLGVMICLLIWVLLIIKIGDGRNWARIVFLVLFLLGIPFYFHGLTRLFSSSVIWGMLSLAQSILQLIALVLLFSRDARLWFKPPETLSTTTPQNTKTVENM